jgi:hypothetical protein
VRAVQPCQLSFEALAADEAAPACSLHVAVSAVQRADPAPSPDGVHDRGAEPALGGRILSASPGRVWFHFLYHHNMRRRSEVTERFSCPFCLLACASFQGLQEHLQASHDKFSYTFSDPARC